MRYVQTFSKTANDCMYNSIHQCVDVHSKLLLSLMEGPDVLWQQRMIYTLGRLGFDVEMIDFVKPNGKTGMQGFAFMEEHPKGKFILYMENHVCAVIDGALFDKADTRFKPVYWALKLTSKQLKHEN